MNIGYYTPVFDTSPLPSRATNTIICPPSLEVEEEEKHWTLTQLQALIVLSQLSDFADDGDGLYRLWKNLSRASNSVCKFVLVTWRCEESSWRRRRRWKKREVRVQVW